MKSSWAERTMDTTLRWDSKGKLSKHHYNIVFENSYIKWVNIFKAVSSVPGTVVTPHLLAAVCQVSLSHFVFTVFLPLGASDVTSSASSHVKWPCTTIVLWFCSFLEFCPYSPLNDFLLRDTTFHFLYPLLSNHLPILNSTLVPELTLPSVLSNLLHSIC